jgi:transposase
MQVMHARCAGLDVHKHTVVACVRVTTAGRAQHEVRTFATTAAGLRGLQEWLVGAGCTHAVLESTGGRCPACHSTRKRPWRSGHWT